VLSDSELLIDALSDKLIDSDWLRLCESEMLSSSLILADVERLTDSLWLAYVL
jgi:hypothetical protein